MKHYKTPPPVRTSAFVRGGTYAQISLYFSTEEVGLLSELIQSTDEMYVNDAIKVILMGLTASPPSGLMMNRQSHLTLLGEYANIVDRVYRQKLRDAESEAESEIIKHLTERGISE
jgi:hypothetical protein